MKKIPLDKGQFSLVDDDDYEYLMQWRWFAKWSDKTRSFYAVRSENFLLNGKKTCRTIRMHRVVMSSPKKLDCDHINHDTLDNRKENLRNVTRVSNGRNRKGAQSNSLSGVLGVRKTKYGFMAFINVDKRGYTLPTRKNIME